MRRTRCPVTFCDDEYVKYRKIARKLEASVHDHCIDIFIHARWAGRRSSAPSNPLSQSCDMAVPTGMGMAQSCDVAVPTGVEMAQSCDVAVSRGVETDLSCDVSIPTGVETDRSRDT